MEKKAPHVVIYPPPYQVTQEKHRMAHGSHPLPTARPQMMPGRQEIFTTSTSNMGSGSEFSVIREQYCMCTPRTKLEKNLIITIGVMGITIILLVIGLGLALDKNCDGFNRAPSNGLIGLFRRKD